MWCERKGVSDIEKLKDYITYFEGTCEFCIDNIGVSPYLDDISLQMNEQSKNSNEKNMYLFFIFGLMQFKLGDLDTAFDSWLEAEKYAKKEHNDFFLAKIKSYYSIYFYEKKKRNQSEKNEKEAVSILKKNSEYTELALHYINFLVYKRYDENKEEISAYLDNASYYVQQSSSILDARIYLHIGYIYKTIFHDFLRGLDYLSVSRDLCRKNNNIEMETMSLHTLADGYIDLLHYDEAIEIYEQILNDPRYARITGNLKCMILANLIPCYINLNQMEKAEASLESMERYVENTQLNTKEQFRCNAKWLRAELYLKKNCNLDEVLKLLKECEEFYSADKQHFRIPYFDSILAGNYGDLFFKQDLYTKALEYYKSQYSLAEIYPDPVKKTACRNLSRVYKQLGEYHKALEFSKMEDRLFEKMRSRNILTEYDRLYKEYYNKVQQQQIQELTEKQRKLQHYVFNDELTALYNKTFFQEYIKSHEKQKNLGAIMFDIDDFKKYNDNYGHLKGDEVLSSVSKIISSTAEKYNWNTIRYGGEEILIFAEKTDRDSLVSAADTIVKEIAGRQIVHIFSDTLPYITISAGCSIMDITKEEDYNTLLEKADSALYFVKKNGKNNVHFEE